MIRPTGIYLPALEERVRAVHSTRETADAFGTETILLPDDEPVVGEMWGYSRKKGGIGSSPGGREGGHNRLLGKEGQNRSDYP